MTPSEAVAVLQSITYKPGWTLLAGEHEHGSSVYFHMLINPLDSTKADHKTRTSVDMTVSWGGFELRDTTKEKLLRQVRRRIHDLELHEADEWFKVDDTAPFHPHPEAHA